LTANTAGMFVQLLGFFIFLFILLMGFSMLIFLVGFVGYWITLNMLEKVNPKLAYKIIGHKE
jgi:hypothetical protein